MSALATMPETPLLSVIMASDRGGGALDAAITSLVGQEYGNWELILVDDGSPAGFEAQVSAFRDERIRLIRIDQNSGLACALNLALEKASGRFVARMDADDVMEPSRLGQQLLFMLTEGLALCGTAATKFGSEHGTIYGPVGGQNIVDSLLVGNPFVHPSMMFDREKCGEELRYRPDFRCEEDYELWSRLVTAKNCGNLGQSLLRYRVGAFGNANHPAKFQFNRIALEQFAQRFGVADVAPTDVLSEFQMTGFADAGGWQTLVAYAKTAEREGFPRLGYLQAPLVEIDRYDRFVDWLAHHQRMSVYLGARGGRSASLAAVG